MAQYIDREILHQKLHEAGGCGAKKDSWADGWDKAIDEAIRLLNEQPTADVAPKSEVEELKELLSVQGRCNSEIVSIGDKLTADLFKAENEVERLTKVLNSYALQYGTVQSQQAIINKAKADATKEIFDEIEREIEDALKNNYEALRCFEDSDDLWHNVNGKINTLRGLEHFIGELKKKIEEKYGGSQ